MPYQNDMMSLADVVGGAAAAQQAGIQNSNENQQEAVKTQLAQATLPAEIEKANLANALLQAQGQNEWGVAAQNTAAGQTAMGAQPSAQAATIAGNQGKVTEAHVNQLQSLGQIVGQLDQSMQGIPDAAKPAMVGQFLDNNGVQDPQIRQMMLNAASQPGGLQQISKGLFDASTAARQTSMAENIRGGYQLGTAQINAQGGLARAEATANARVQVAQIAKQMKEQSQTFEQASTAAYKRGDKATGDQMAALALQVRQAQAQLNSQLLFGQQMGVPGAGAPTPVPEQQGGAPAAPQGNTNQPPAVEDAVTAEMRKRGYLK